MHTHASYTTVFSGTVDPCFSPRPLASSETEKVPSGRQFYLMWCVCVRPHTCVCVHVCMHVRVPELPRAVHSTTKLYVQPL